MSDSFSKNTKNRPKSNDLRPLRRLLPFLLKYRGRVIIALFALLVASVATLAVPLAVRSVLDNGFTTENAGLVNQYFLLMFAVVVALAAGSAIRFYYVMWLGERVIADIRDALFNHLVKLTPSFYETQKTGEVVSRLTADTTQIKAAFSSTASIALRNGVMLLGGLGMMIYTSPFMSGLAALAIPAVVLPLVFTGRKVRALSRLAQDALAGSAAFAQERLAGMTAIQANTQESSITRQFQKLTITAFDAAQSRTLTRAILTFAVIIVSLGAIVALIWFGAHQVIAGHITGGILGQFILYAVFTASSLGQLSEVWGDIQMAAGAAERISELLDEKPSISSPINPIALAAPVKGTLKFENVDFRYPSRQKTKVLRKISFEAKSGEVLAIVGPSGAGKTTLYALLQRFQVPESGTITFDGIDIASLDLKDLRGNIAIVPQDPTIFSGSISENISLGRPSATHAEIVAAASAARVSEFTEKLPEQYDTLLGERGVTLSGGQRQRVAIARAVLRNAPVLLLDEATSALDAESEALIQEALVDLTKGRTTLVIAHRLATIRNADRIIVLDQGKIVGQGTHTQLLKKSPLYAKLAKLQFIK